MNGRAGPAAHARPYIGTLNAVCFPLSRSHATQHLAAEMRALRASTLAMGARCERILGLALDAFWRGAREVDEEVRVLDGLILTR